MEIMANDLTNKAVEAHPQSTASDGNKSTHRTRALRTVGLWWAAQQLW